MISNQVRVSVGDEASPTRQRILDAAVSLFAERGYAGASMGDIADRVGVRKPSLYNYIRSKEELLVELVEICLDSWKHSARPKLVGEASASSRLKAHFEAAIAFTREQPDAVAVLRLASSQLSGELDVRIAERVDVHFQTYRQELGKFFRQAIDAGELQADEPDELVLVWTAWLDGVIGQVMRSPEAASLYLDRLDSLSQRMWRALGGVEPETKSTKTRPAKSCRTKAS